jgi:hypothetical protein
MSTSPEKKPLRRLTSADVRPSLLSAALDYHRRGFCPIPQRPGEKRPFIKWTPYQDVQPSVACLEDWFARQFRDAGIALVLGPAFNLFVIDVDGANAERSLVALLGAVPEAPTVLSGSGSLCKYHLYFQHPDVPTQARYCPWHPQLELRGHRGIVVAPPSVHTSGNRYRWAEGRSLDDVTLPEVPVPILAALRARAKSRARSGPGQPAPTPSEPLTPEQRQARTLAIHLLDGIADSTLFFLLGLESEGPGWNAKLFRASCDLMGCGTSLEQAMPLLMLGARPWTDRDRAAAEATIRSAYSRSRLAARHRAVEARRAARPNRRFSFTIPVKKYGPSEQGGQPA